MAEKLNHILPFGTWPSPITAALISQRTRIDDVQFSKDGKTLVWCEGRSNGSALVAQWIDVEKGLSPQRVLTDEQTPRGGVGYGGGAFTVSGEKIVFANRDGRLYQRGFSSEPPAPITPSFGPSPSGAVASPTVSPDEQWIAYVYSDGNEDLIALVDSNGAEWPQKLAHGADFYMQPTWHPDGHHLAWVEWDHPNMPWDATRIQFATLGNETPKIKEVKTIGGGENIPAQQPIFSPDGQWLCFAEETGEWPDLILYNIASGERKVLVKGDGFEVAPPTWVQGNRTMGWSPTSQRVFYLRNYGATTSLWEVDIESGISSPMDVAPFTSINQLSVSPVNDDLAFIASSPKHPAQIVYLSQNKIQTIALSMAETFDTQFLPVPTEISWPASDGTLSHGLYYPPTHPLYTGIGKPPALVHIHGGPTAIANNQFNSEAAYFTSRGYAYVEVNYRGGTGYGRTYREALRHRWGEVDVEDAANCARTLNDFGLADAQRLIIIGGSAGGYTVLNTLIRHPGLYKAGICLYGVTNLFNLDLETHKFEAHYTATLVGKLPGAASLYHDWSPVFHADQIRDALYIFQGAEDKVVPPSQAEEIVATLRAHGTAHKYKLYPGEGHGFRKSETISDYLHETERFLQQQVIFAA